MVDGVRRGLRIAEGACEENEAKGRGARASQAGGWCTRDDF